MFDTTPHGHVSTLQARTWDSRKGWGPDSPTLARTSPNSPQLPATLAKVGVMDLEELIGNLRAVGSDTTSVEVKSASGGLPASLTPTMSAFANMPGGGLVILGLDEASRFRATGVADAPAIAAALASRARQAFDPPIQLNIEVEPFEGVDLVLARIQETPPSAKPCTVKRTGQAFLRFADGDYALSRLEVDGFAANRTRPRFDESVVPNTSTSDLDTARVEDFVATARAMDRRLRPLDDATLLRRTGVLHNGCATVAGLLALGEYPQQHLPHCTIRAALHFDDTSTVRALDSATFTGPIPAMLDEAVEWVARNSRNRIVQNPSGQVVTQLDPPAIAVRELVANSLVHRDLAEWASSRSIELRLTNTAMRITNPGGLYGITADRLGVHPLTSARNRRLLEICKFVKTGDANVVEARASGIPATIAALSAAEMPPPRFFDQALAFTVTVDRTTTPRRTTTATAAKVTSSEREVLVALQHPRTVKALAADLRLSENAIHKRLGSLRAKGLVAMEGGQGQQSVYRRADERLPS